MKIIRIILILTWTSIAISCNRGSVNESNRTDKKTVISWHDSINRIPSKIFLHSTIEDNFIDGIFILYRKDGTIIGKIPMKDGAKEGMVEKFYSNGQLFISIEHKEGLKHGIAKTYTSEGQLLSKGSYCEDKKCGKWVYYRRDGQVKEIEEYPN